MSRIHTSALFYYLGHAGPYHYYYPRAAPFSESIASMHLTHRCGSKSVVSSDCEVVYNRNPLYLVDG